MRPRSNPWIERQDGVAGRSSPNQTSSTPYFLRTLFFLVSPPVWPSPSTGFFLRSSAQNDHRFLFRERFLDTALAVRCEDDEPLMPFGCSATNTTRHYWQIDPAYPALDGRCRTRRPPRRRRESIRGGWPYQTRDYVLFRFTNMLADDRSKIHAGQMELQFFGQDLRRFLSTKRRGSTARSPRRTARGACSAFARRTGVFFFTWGVRVFRRITGAVAISQIPFRFIRDCPSGTTTYGLPERRLSITGSY